MRLYAGGGAAPGGPAPVPAPARRPCGRSWTRSRTPTSRRLYEDILAGAPGRRRRAAPRRPRAAAAAAGATGMPEPGADGARPEAPRPARRHNLPTPITSFVGREAEVAEVTRLLLAGTRRSAAASGVAGGTAPRLVTLTGPGGCGKTRLALEVARALVRGGRRTRTASGWWSWARSPSRACWRRRWRPRSACARRRAGRCWRPWPAPWPSAACCWCWTTASTCWTPAPPWPAPCCGPAPGCASWPPAGRPWAWPGEVTCRVPSLALPASTPALGRRGVGRAATAWRGTPAVRLFVERASFGQPGFALTAQNAAAVVQSAGAWTGSPWPSSWPPPGCWPCSAEQLAARLDDRFRLLTSGQPHRPGAAADAAGDGGLELRPADAGRAGPVRPPGRLRRGLHPGGRRGGLRRAPPARTTRPGGRPRPPLPAGGQVPGREASEDAEGQVRYRLLETLREYARERLERRPGRRGDAGAPRRLLRRPGRARRGGPGRAAPGGLAAPPGAGARQPAGRPALAPRSARRARGAAPGGGARPVLDDARRPARGPGAPGGRAGPGRGREATAPGRGAGQGALPRRLPRLAAGRRRGGAPLLEAGVAMARESGRRRGHRLRPLLPRPGAPVPGRLPGGAGPLRGQPAGLRGGRRPGGAGPGPVRAGEPVPPGGRGRSGAGPAGAQPGPLPGAGRPAQPGPAPGLPRPGGPAHRATRPGPGPAWRRRWPSCEDIGETWLVASVLDNLAEVARCEDDQARAEGLLRRSLALWRELGSTGTQAQGALHQLGHVALDRGRPARADALFRESLSLARAQGNKRHVGEALAGLAGVAAATGQPEQAARLFGAAGAVRQAVGAALSPADRDRPPAGGGPGAGGRRRDARSPPPEAGGARRPRSRSIVDGALAAASGAAPTSTATIRLDVTPRTLDAVRYTRRCVHRRPRDSVRGGTLGRRGSGGQGRGVRARKMGPMSRRPRLTIAGRLPARDLDRRGRPSPAPWRCPAAGAGRARPTRRRTGAGAASSAAPPRRRPPRRPRPSALGADAVSLRGDGPHRLG